MSDAVIITLIVCLTIIIICCIGFIVGVSIYEDMKHDFDLLIQVSRLLRKNYEQDQNKI